MRVCRSWVPCSAICSRDPFCFQCGTGAGPLSSISIAAKVWALEECDRSFSGLPAASNGPQEKTALFERTVARCPDLPAAAVYLEPVWAMSPFRRARTPTSDAPGRSRPLQKTLPPLLVRLNPRRALFRSRPEQQARPCQSLAHTLTLTRSHRGRRVESKLLCESIPAMSCCTLIFALVEHRPFHHLHPQQSISVFPRSL